MDSPASDPTPPRKRILVVDPDEASRSRMRESLALPEFEILEVAGMGDALAIARREPLAVVVTELALADGSGLALCRSIRESESLASTPIVVVSLWCTEADRILAFECGGDDFLAKPYFGRELASRLRAVMRRTARAAPERGSERARPPGGLSIDSSRRGVWIEGVLVPLTQREYALLEALIRSRGHVLSRGDLIRQVWSDAADVSERSVDAQVKGLRRKLGTLGDAIQTVRGLGYRLFTARPSGPPPVERGATEPPLRRAPARRRVPMR